MKLTKEQAKAILKMADHCYSEGLLNTDAYNLSKEILEMYPELKKDKYLYTKYLED